MNTTPKKVEGAQSVYRALDMLGLIARGHVDGVPLGDLVTAMGLDRTTAYRLVSTLEHENLIERHPDSRRYRLGMAAMQIGLTTMSRAPILEECLPVMQALARESEDTVFLIVRNGDYAHCLHLEQGAFPIRATTQHVDGLRLLGLGTAGQALLATLPDAEIESIHRRNQVDYLQHDFPLPRLLRTVAQIRRDDYAVTTDIITPGVRGVGVAFGVGEGGHAAISIASIANRMPPLRGAWLVDRIRARLDENGFISVPGNSPHHT